MKEDGLVAEDANGALTVLAPDGARAHLDTKWDGLMDPACMERMPAVKASFEAL
ncbi:hypothetical protein A7A08_00836 [Methyloligella halotolerans]|uniref:Uncharacterized protein n=1 Tax=Methyloligella halotolerans TaxID=1177755 RepID=A0A1E2S3M1_9HYPH|nr:hypothetical protein [Methyloligella halotolerans]ODA69000.1 hypothetical protein A7A08_00836 [Methyloligella halotolerans]